MEESNSTQSVLACCGCSVFSSCIEFILYSTVTATATPPSLLYTGADGNGGGGVVGIWSGLVVGWIGG